MNDRGKLGVKLRLEMPFASIAGEVIMFSNQGHNTTSAVVIAEDPSVDCGSADERIPTID